MSRIVGNITLGKEEKPKTPKKEEVVVEKVVEKVETPKPKTTTKKK